MVAVGEPEKTWKCPACHRDFPREFTVCPIDHTPRVEDAAVAGDALIGEVLGRTYKLARVLGQGGMAKLYEAEHLRIETRFAVKVIHDDLAREPDLLTRFEREARAAGRIHSENVVRLVDVLRTADGRPCLVTELLQGEDLQATLDRVGKLSVAETIPIARQLCRAVAAAHAASVVHRDLKPSNVFICKGEPLLIKVFDFGVAKLEDDDKLTRTDAVMGTAAYMSPEQARRAADAGPLADVYSIGAVMYHMLAGEPPYGNVPALSRLAMVLHEEPARPRDLEPSIPEGVEAVIQHAMARDPASRIQTAEDLEVQLAAFDRPLRPRASTPLPVPREIGPTTTAELAAADIQMRAKLARPIGGFVAAASSIAFGAWLAALLATIVSASSTGEHALIALFGLAGAAGVGMLHAHKLRPSWASVPAVTRHTRPWTRALLAIVVTLGALELLTYGSLAMFHGAPLSSGWRLVLAGIAGGLGLGWRSWGLDERLRRRLG